MVVMTATLIAANVSIFEFDIQCSVSVCAWTEIVTKTDLCIVSIDTIVTRWSGGLGGKTTQKISDVLARHTETSL